MSSNAASSTAPISESRANDPRYTPSPPTTAAYSHNVAIDISNVGKEATLTVHPNPHSFDGLHSPQGLAPYSSDSGSFAADKPASARSHRPEASNVLQKQLSSGFDTTFFEFNDASSLTGYFIATGIAKAHSAVWPRFVSGLLSGLFVVFGAVFALVAAGGISADTRSASPAIPKILTGITFPIALVLIMFVGGDLFTGNCLYVGVGWFSGRVTLRQSLNVLLVSFFSNLCGCLFFSYFLGYRTELFTAAPYNSWMLSVADGKVGEGWGEVVLRGIGANTLVCIGIFMGSSSRSALGRLVIAWIPVMVFSIIGYDHVVANMVRPHSCLTNQNTLSISLHHYISLTQSPVSFVLFILCLGFHPYCSHVWRYQLHYRSIHRQQHGSSRHRQPHWWRNSIGRLLGILVRVEGPTARDWYGALAVQLCAEQVGGCGRGGDVASAHARRAY